MLHSIALTIFILIILIRNSSVIRYLIFRELPNPLCTYQLYQSFVHAVQGCNNVKRNSLTDHERLLKMREAVQKLPPPHYRFVLKI